jgi:hypothetical protein
MKAFLTEWNPLSADTATEDQELVSLGTDLDEDDLSLNMDDNGNEIDEVYAAQLAIKEHSVEVAMSAEKDLFTKVSEGTSDPSDGAVSSIEAAQNVVNTREKEDQLKSDIAQPSHVVSQPDTVVPAECRQEHVDVQPESVKTDTCNKDNVTESIQFKPEEPSVELDNSLEEMVVKMINDVISESVERLDIDPGGENQVEQQEDAINAVHLTNNNFESVNEEVSPNEGTATKNSEDGLTDNNETRGRSGSPENVHTTGVEQTKISTVEIIVTCEDVESDPAEEASTVDHCGVTDNQAKDEPTHEAIKQDTDVKPRNAGREYFISAEEEPIGVIIKQDIVIQPNDKATQSLQSAEVNEVIKQDIVNDDPTVEVIKQDIVNEELTGEVIKQHIVIQQKDDAAQDLQSAEANEASSGEIIKQDMVIQPTDDETQDLPSADENELTTGEVIKQELIIHPTDEASQDLHSAEGKQAENGIKQEINSNNDIQSISLVALDLEVIVQEVGFDSEKEQEEYQVAATQDEEKENGIFQRATLEQPMTQVNVNEEGSEECSEILPSGDDEVKDIQTKDWTDGGQCQEESMEITTQVQVNAFCLSVESAISTDESLVNLAQVESEEELSEQLPPVITLEGADGDVKESDIDEVGQKAPVPVEAEKSVHVPQSGAITVKEEMTVQIAEGDKNFDPETEESTVQMPEGEELSETSNASQLPEDTDLTDLAIQHSQQYDISGQSVEMAEPIPVEMLVQITDDNEQNNVMTKVATEPSEPQTDIPVSDIPDEAASDDEIASTSQPVRRRLSSIESQVLHKILLPDPLPAWCVLHVPDLLPAFALYMLSA